MTHEHLESKGGGSLVIPRDAVGHSAYSPQSQRGDEKSNEVKTPHKRHRDCRVFIVPAITELNGPIQEWE